MMVKVTQEVRQSARDYLAEQTGYNWGLEYILDGMGDDEKIVQAFANIYQRGKLEGARLALEEVSSLALMSSEECACEIKQDAFRAWVGIIAALDPAKIVTLPNPPVQWEDK